jgi:amidase
MCGLVGYKPPYGRNPEDGAPYNLDTYNHQGPMARHVVDCALMQNIMSGPHPKDITTVKPKINIPLNLNTDLHGWKIAYSLNLGFYTVEPDITQNMLTLLAQLRDLGAQTEEVEINWSSNINDAAMTYLYHLFGSDLDSLIEGNESLVTDYALDFAKRARKTTARMFLDAQVTACEMYNTFGPLMENYQAFICPTLATTHIKADHSPTTPAIINNQPTQGPLSWCMTPAFNMLSRCPVLSIPSGLAHNGIPTSIQIVGKTYDDETVFRVAYALEKLNPWYDAKHRPNI